MRSIRNVKEEPARAGAEQELRVPPFTEVAYELAKVRLLLHQFFDGDLGVYRGIRTDFLGSGVADLFDVSLHLLVALLRCDEASGFGEGETLVEGTEGWDEREADHDAPN